MSSSTLKMHVKLEPLVTAQSCRAAARKALGFEIASQVWNFSASTRVFDVSRLLAHLAVAVTSTGKGLAGEC